ncbi:MAG: DUF3108 domain-containing protein [Terrimicrobiaceae bacterium]
MTRWTSLLALGALVAAPSLFAWQETLIPDLPGPFPEVAPFVANFKIGWSEIEAARAHAEIAYNGSQVALDARGGTEGLARSLYQLDARFQGTVDRPTLHTLRSDQVETYSDRSLTTIVTGSNGALRTFSDPVPPGKKPAKWKEVKIQPVRDFFAGMLFIRSQALARGDMVRLLMFPGGSSFFVEIHSAGPRTIHLDDGPCEALQLDLKIQRVNHKKGNSLEPHSKFRSGKIWLSNDARRIPLRAEVDIFIGYVFAEILDYRTTGEIPALPPTKNGVDKSPAAER